MNKPLIITAVAIVLAAVVIKRKQAASSGGLSWSTITGMTNNMTTVRGIRNNNPLNIRESKGDNTNWVGERVTNDDSAFEEFTHVKFGFRAAARILRSYQRRGINTIHGIIHTFAPSHENETDHYANLVSEWTGISKYTPIDVKNDDLTANLLQAMARMEVGREYPISEVMQGVKLA